MANVFSTVLNMSLTACIVIAIVMLARLALRKAPKIFSYALWSAVLFRLLCPVAISLPLSVLFPLDGASTQSSAVTSRMEYVYIPNGEFSAVDNADASPNNAAAPGESGIIDNGAPANEHDSSVAQTGHKAERSVGEIALTVLGWIWLAGVVGVFGVTLWQTHSMKRMLSDACIIRGNIYESDRIDTAFVLGVFNPKIYLPLGLPFDIQKAVVSHEQTHQRRGDNIIKLVSYIALSLHWFNPLVWLSFKLMCDDMEKSCDEAVVRGLHKRGYSEKSVKKAYSRMLFAFGNGRQNVFSPVSFAEHSVKSRIINVAGYSRLARNAAIVLCAVCVLVAGVCVINPIGISADERYATEGLVFSFDRTDKFGKEFDSAWLPKEYKSCVTKPCATVVDYVGTDRNVYIPRTYQGVPVRAIGLRAFEGKDIIDVRIPDTMVYIGGAAFMNCTSLKTITIPNSVYDMRNAFVGCTSLTSVDLSDNTMALEDFVFMDCTSLTELEIPPSVALIGNYAFIGSGVEEAFPFADIDCFIDTPEALTHLYIDDSYIKVADLGFFQQTLNDKGITEKIKILEISGGTRHIGSHAFSGCHSIETIILHDGVRFIDETALHCLGATAIVIPDSVCTIVNDFHLNRSNVTVYCNTGSFAYKWAQTYGYRTAPIDEFDYSAIVD